MQKRAESMWIVTGEIENIEVILWRKK